MRREDLVLILSDRQFMHQRPALVALDVNQPRLAARVSARVTPFLEAVDVGIVRVRRDAGAVPGNAH
jgi:hypothetical protein